MYNCSETASNLHLKMAPYHERPHLRNLLQAQWIFGSLFAPGLSMFPFGLRNIEIWGSGMTVRPRAISLGFKPSNAAENRNARRPRILHSGGLFPGACPAGGQAVGQDSEGPCLKTNNSTVRHSTRGGPVQHLTESYVQHQQAEALSSRLVVGHGDNLPQLRVCNYDGDGLSDRTCFMWR